MDNIKQRRCRLITGSAFVISIDLEKGKGVRSRKVRAPFSRAAGCTAIRKERSGKGGNTMSVMNYDVTTVIWVLVASALIYFMQAGFALCEAGLTRAKNTGNILMKNLMDFCIGTPCYWLVGFGIMFGSTAPIIGRLDPMIRGIYGAENTVVPSSRPSSVRQQRRSSRDPWRSARTSRLTACTRRLSLF